MTLDCIQALCSNHSPEFDFSPHFTMLANQLSSQTFGDTKQVRIYLSPYYTYYTYTTTHSLTPPISQYQTHPK